MVLAWGVEGVSAVGAGCLSPDSDGQTSLIWSDPWVVGWRLRLMMFLFLVF